MMEQNVYAAKFKYQTTIQVHHINNTDVQVHAPAVA